MATTPRDNHDVAIVGGGPAGSATAISLRTHAPSLSVVLIEASTYNSFRIGETLPPPARSILEHLGVWDAFIAQHHREVFGTAAAWGTSEAFHNDFFYMPANTGWHLDRSAFDAMLVKHAESSGATVVSGARIQDVERSDGQWHLTINTVKSIRARFVVDATGGSAKIARRCGGRYVGADNLVSIARLFKDNISEPRTLIESFRDGWWYTAGLPGGVRIAACFTDADIARRLKLSDVEGWQTQLKYILVIGALLERCEQYGPAIIRSTESRRLEPAAGDNWLAVGDAASRFDPLSSQGIVKALRSGIFASYAIGDLLTETNRFGMRRYRQYVENEFRSYLETRLKYYGEEQRWPDSEFWRRRHVTREKVEVEASYA